MENSLKCYDYIIKHLLLIIRKKICDYEIPKYNTDVFIIRDETDFITTSIGGFNGSNTLKQNLLNR